MHDKLTRSDIKKMEEEIEYRKVVVRHKALEDVKSARELGDLSENFEYYAAKKYKNQNESRIRYLENMIRTAKIIDDSSEEDEVGMNNTVTIEYQDDHSVQEIKIVTTVRADSLGGYITPESPLGKALFRHKAGDIVHVSTGMGEDYDVRIIKIENTDDTGDTLARY